MQMRAARLFRAWCGNGRHLQLPAVSRRTPWEQLGNDQPRRLKLDPHTTHGPIWNAVGRRSPRGRLPRIVLLNWTRRGLGRRARPVLHFRGSSECSLRSACRLQWKGNYSLSTRSIVHPNLDQTLGVAGESYHATTKITVGMSAERGAMHTRNERAEVGDAIPRV